MQPTDPNYPDLVIINAMTDIDGAARSLDTLGRSLSELSALVADGRAHAISRDVLEKLFALEPKLAAISATIETFKEKKS